MERTQKGQVQRMKRTAMAALDVGDVACALDYMQCAKDAELAMLEEQRESIVRAKRRFSDGVLAFNTAAVPAEAQPER